MRNVKFLLVCVVFLTLTSLSYSETIIPGGTVTGTWTLAGSPYIIQNTIQLLTADVLIIEPGVHVKFQNQSKWTIFGCLSAVGTETDSIYFEPFNANIWGGIRVLGNMPFFESIFVYCSFDSSRAWGTSYPLNRGGGLYIEDSNTIVSHCSFFNCESGLVQNAGGGAIFCEDANPTITYNLISNCRGYFGGGIGGNYFTGVILGNTIENCASNYGDLSLGAGIFLSQESDCIVDSNIIANNTAYLGGGIAIMYSSNPIVKNNIIVNNTALQGGAFLYHGGTIDSIYNNTVYGNTATTGGSIGYNHGVGQPKFDSNIFWNNQPAGSPFWASTTGLEVKYCDIEGGYAGIGNINSDPLFVDAVNMDFNLTGDSPCIDSGNPLLAFDPDSTLADMGALYFDQAPGPRIAVSSNQFDFSTTPIGGNSILPLTIYNVGLEDLILYSISSGASVFTTNWDPADSIIASSDSLELDVIFTPVQLIYYSGIMTIASNSIMPLQVTINLTGPEAVMELSADSLQFPNTGIGFTSSLPLMVCNTGDMDMVVYDITIDEETFSVNWLPGDSLIAAGDSMELTVAFSPAEPILFTGTMTIETNAGEGEISLSGLESSATVYIEFTPHILNIQIPPGGGSFSFDVSIINPVLTTIVDVFTTVETPSGYEIPILSRNGTTVQGGTQISKSNLTQWVPASVPAGDYIYHGYLKDPITWEIISEDEIPFTKVSGMDSFTHNHGWELWGFDSETPTAELPSCFKIASISPNPFNPETSIEFDIAQAGNVTLTVYDIAGRIVAELAEGNYAPGSHIVKFDGSRLASGIYFARLQSAGKTSTQKMMLVK